MFDRTIDGSVSKLDRQRRRRRGERGADRGGGHADRAEIVGLAVVRMVRRLATVGRCNDQAVLGAVAADRVDVAEGQRNVDGQRDQREPRTMPDIIPNPAHSEPTPRAFRPRSNLI